jgi:hypothetical protein
LLQLKDYRLMTNLHFTEYFFRVANIGSFSAHLSFPTKIFRRHIFLFEENFATRNHPVTKQHWKPTILRAAISYKFSVAKGS